MWSWCSGLWGSRGPVEGPPLTAPLPLSLSAADVKFISNPPSMVAAGSVVAAVQGLHLGSSNSFLSYHRLTRFLSKVIKCDAVSDRSAAPALAWQDPKLPVTDGKRCGSCQGPQSDGGCRGPCVGRDRCRVQRQGTWPRLTGCQPHPTVLGLLWEEKHLPELAGRPGGSSGFWRPQGSQEQAGLPGSCPGRGATRQARQ